jgi:hypothetical protein
MIVSIVSTSVRPQLLWMPPLQPMLTNMSKTIMLAMRAITTITTITITT